MAAQHASLPSLPRCSDRKRKVGKKFNKTASTSSDDDADTGAAGGAAGGGGSSSSSHRKSSGGSKSSSVKKEGRSSGGGKSHCAAAVAVDQDGDTVMSCDAPAPAAATDAPSAPAKPPATDAAAHAPPAATKPTPSSARARALQPHQVPLPRMTKAAQPAPPAAATKKVNHRLPAAVIAAQRLPPIPPTKPRVGCTPLKKMASTDWQAEVDALFKRRLDVSMSATCVTSVTHASFQLQQRVGFICLSMMYLLLLRPVHG